MQEKHNIKGNYNFAINYVSSTINGFFFQEDVHISQFVLQNQIIGAVPHQKRVGFLKEVN